MVASLVSRVSFSAGVALWYARRHIYRRRLERSMLKLSKTYYRLRDISAGQHWRYRMLVWKEYLLDVAMQFGHGALTVLPFAVLGLSGLMLLAAAAYALSRL